ncbi:MAG: class I SAM-dependent methyltransferase, partial [Planctomycetota bacterium]|nr:class I SAM-dependent methyltransferase [Planctomycetota bacterium]
MTEPQPSETHLRLRPVPCDFCGSDEADPYLSGPDRLCGLEGEFHVVRCARCGLLRTNPQPVIEDLPKAYPSSYEVHATSVEMPDPPAGLLRWALVNYRSYPLGEPSSALVRALAWPLVVRRLRSRYGVGYLPYEGEGRLLDFGCGVGKYVAQMRAAGWNAEGMDLVPEPVRVGREAGLTAHQGSLPGAALEAGRFDAVTLRATLEHVPSPLATLRTARHLLRTGGYLMVIVPNFASLAADWFGSAWYGLDVPRHLTHFTQATLARHLEAAGFRLDRAIPIRRPTF